MSNVKRTFADVRPGQKPGLKDVANLIKDGKAKNVIIMAGAGISTSAGIPDFRSPETGLYANLEKYNLPYPEAIFDIDYFLEKPQAFYTLARELYPGNFAPTTTHHFFRLLQDKGALRAVFTQNIDTLERIAGVDDEMVVEAHGSFEEAECLACKKIYSKESIKPQIELGQVVYCSRDKCKGNKKALVKPKIVFFGEGLPERFFDRITDFAACDLLIVIGTSLSVQPFASLVNRVSPTCPRLLINLESVGEMSTSAPRFLGARGDGFDFDGILGRKEGIRDVRWLGQSDEGVLEFARVLGWEDELKELEKKGKMLLNGAAKEANVGQTLKEVEQAAEGVEQKKKGEIDELAEQVTKVTLDGDNKVDPETDGETIETEVIVDGVEASNEAKEDQSKSETLDKPPKATL